jgi:SAM-dependent methyltransferase
MPFQETPATRKWRDMVAVEREQTESSREGAPERDFWRRLARRFAPKAAAEAPDPTVAALTRIVDASDTVIDVGAGGGRLAIPLAALCARVIAVEPSEGMRRQLEQSASQRQLKNLDVIATDWISADVRPCDVVLCAHVLYGIEDIEPFLDKLNAHARRLVAVVMQPRSPMSNFYPLWRMVHGEPRKALPSLPEFLEILQSWRISYDVARLPPTDLNLFGDVEEATDYSMQRLFLAPETAKAKRLVEVLKEVLVEADGGFRFEWTRPFSTRVVTWMLGDG